HAPAQVFAPPRSQPVPTRRIPDIPHRREQGRPLALSIKNAPAAALIACATFAATRTGCSTSIPVERSHLRAPFAASLLVKAAWPLWECRPASDWSAPRLTASAAASPHSTPR